MWTSTVAASAVLLVSITPTSVHAWGSPFLRTTTGCGAVGFDVDSSGHLNRTLPSGRTYLLHVPEEYNASIASPLVLSFHGADGTSTQQERLSQFSVPGSTIGGLPFLAAYPQGVPGSSNRSATWYSAPYANTSVDDVQFTKDILADLSSAYCLNPLRIYAAGKSNGGGFVAYLACRPDTTALFAAFAPVSPALYPGTLAFEGCDPARPVPIITGHGVQDQTIPFAGRNDSKTGEYGVGSSTINVQQWRREWAVRNGCQALPGGSNGTSSLPEPTESSEPYADFEEDVWECNARIQAYTGEKLGHSWPTVQGLDNSGSPNNTASFNLTSPDMLDFFSRTTLPVAYLQ